MRLTFPPYPRSGPSHDALRHWIDTAGTWHVQVEPEQLAHADPVHLALLQSRLLALLDIVERITDPARRRTGNPNVASLDEVMDFVSQVFPERAGGELRPVAAAAIEGI